MASRLIAAHLDLNQNQILNAVVQVLTADPSSIGGQIWYRSDLSNGVGNGVLSYKDSSSNVIRLAVGGVALSNAYIAFTDGTTTTTTSGGETFQPVASGTGLTVAVVNNNAGFGSRDTFTYTLNSATSGANKVLLLDASGGIAHSSYIALGAYAGSTNGVLSFTNTGLGRVQVYSTAAGALQTLLTTGNDENITGQLSFTKSPKLLNGPTITSAGEIGYSGGNLIFADAAALRTVVSLDQTQTLTNKTLTTPTIASFVNATHTHLNAAGGGTITAAAVSDFTTAVQAIQWRTMAAPTSAVSMNSQKITGLADGTAANDAVSLQQLQAVQTGLDVKSSVRAASTANMTATYNATGGTVGRGQFTAAPNTMDGVTFAANDRILLKDQSTPAQNGIWVVTTVGTGANGVWDRASDFDQDAEVSGGAFTFVEEGTANADRGYVLTTNNPITIGGASGTGLSWTPFSGAGSIIDGAGLVFTGNTLDVVGTAGRIVANANSIDLVSGIITPGTYALTTYDTYGRATVGADIVATTGYVAKTAAGTYAARSITVASTARITVNNSNGVSGDTTLDLATVVTAGTGIINTFDVYGRITAGTDLISSGGIPARTAANTYAARTITPTAGHVTVANGDGVAGNPTIGLPNVGTPGSYDRVTTDAQGRVTAGVQQGFAGPIGDGTATTITVTHSLGTQDVVVAVYSSTTPWAEVYPEVRHTSTTQVTLIFNVAPTAGQYRVVVKGI